MSGYTGETYVPAHYERNGTISIAIINQPFTQYVDANNNTVALYYPYRVKGNGDSDWIVTPDLDQYLEASKAQNTVFPYWINEAWVGDHSGRSPNIPADEKMDIQVEAFIGYSSVICTRIAQRQDDYHTFWMGQSSGWSNTQTISIPYGEVSVSTPEPTSSSSLPDPTTPVMVITPPQNPTASPVQPVHGFSVSFISDWVGVAIVVLLAAIVALLVLVVVYLRKRSPK